LDDLENQYNTVLQQVATLAEDSNYGGQNLPQRRTATLATNESVEFNEDGTSTLSVSGRSGL
jgi:hypothetical protein